MAKVLARDPAGGPNLVEVDVSGGGSGVPYTVPNGDTYTVPTGMQVLWTVPIELVGSASLDISGAFVGVA